MVCAFDRCVVRYCSPTLAGMKCGSMFRLSIEKGDDILPQVRRYNRMLAAKGVSVMLLSRDDRSCIVYVFRWSKLRERFGECDARLLLRERGYRGCSVCTLLAELRRRFRENAEFPHEVGLFLGYPTNDVRCFLCNSHTNGCACGVWKAYNDKSGAEETFRRFATCRREYEYKFENGSSIEELTIAG